LTVEIVLLAMVALFVGLRLYSVLGQRTGHEQQQPIVRPEPNATPEQAAKTNEPAAIPDSVTVTLDKGSAAALRSLIAADPSFDTNRFLDGAQGAYRMILEALWRGDVAALTPYVGDDVRAAFADSIAEREAAGHKLDNRLIAIERAAIENAEVVRKVATIEVRFDAFIAAITRDVDGNVMAGSMTDAVPAHNLWTFRRDLSSNDPNWVLVETDDIED